MRSNFCYRAILEAIKRRAAKFHVPVIEVFAGYTSILGIAKYKKMYTLNRHTAAALLIGRRAMGIVRERENFQLLVRISKKNRKSGVKANKEGDNEPPRTSVDCEVKEAALAGIVGTSQAKNQPKKPKAKGRDRNTASVTLTKHSISRLRANHLRRRGEEYRQVDGTGTGGHSGVKSPSKECKPKRAEFTLPSLEPSSESFTKSGLNPVCKTGTDLAYADCCTTNSRRQAKSLYGEETERARIEIFSN